MAPISENARFQRRQAVLAMEVDDRTLMLDASSGGYFDMDDVTSRIWSLLESPRSLSELCDALEREYDVDRLQCEAEVGDLLQEFIAAGLIDAAAP